MSDKVIRAIAAGGQIRAFAASTRALVEEARERHNTSPVATAALGRLLTAAAMLGTQLKGEQDKISLRIKGDGPIEGLYVISDSRGNVKGFPENPSVLLHARADGKLDVGGAVGKGELTVTRDLGLKEPYIGTCALVNGEIAEDLTSYFAVSEQTPSAVSLGVLMNKENTVAEAGGFLIQLMPGVSDETAALLEEKILNFPNITVWLSEGNTPEDALHTLLDELNLEILEEHPVRFFCSCSRERMEDVLVSLGKHELLDLMLSQEAVTVHCDYCNTDYAFTRPELKAVYKKHFRPEL